MFEDSESTLADSGVICVVVFIWGESIHHFLYDAYTWNQAEKMDLLFILLGRFFSLAVSLRQRQADSQAQIYYMKKRKIPIPCLRLFL